MFFLPIYFTLGKNSTFRTKIKNFKNYRAKTGADKIKKSSGFNTSMNAHLKKDHSKICKHLYKERERRIFKYEITETNINKCNNY